MATIEQHDQEASPESAAFLSFLSFFVLVTFILFGALMGFMMTRLLAGSSDLALLIGVIAFPLCYVVSAILCLDILPLDGLWRMLPQQHYELDDSSSSREKIAYRRRSLIAIPVSVIICAGAGIMVGSLSETSGWIVAPLFTLVGLAYGGVFYSFAQFDILPMTK